MHFFKSTLSSKVLIQFSIWDFYQTDSVEDVLGPKSSGALFFKVPHKCTIPECLPIFFFFFWIPEDVCDRFQGLKNTGMTES